MGQHFYIGPENFRSRSVHQITKRGTMSGPNFKYLYAPVPPTVTDIFLSNFRDVLSSPICTTYRPFFILLTRGQREVKAS